MIKLEDKTMTKKQYIAPQVESIHVQCASMLCASAVAPGDYFGIGGGAIPTMRFSLSRL